MSDGFFFLALLLGVVAWFCAASDAYNQNPKFGLILLLCPAIYWTYALAYPRRRRALASLGLTILAIAAYILSFDVRSGAP